MDVARVQDRGRSTLILFSEARVCRDYNLKSGDELISVKETFGLCEGRAEQHYHILVRAT